MMKPEELQFMRDAATLEATERLADLASLVAGEDGAATLLLGAVMKSLSRSMNPHQVIGQVQCWLQTLTVYEADPAPFN